MRHQKTKHKLSRDSAHRKALLMNLSKEIIEHERIKTSEAKAKAVKPEIEKLITLAKRGDLHARRQALSTLAQDKFAVHKLFEDLAPATPTVRAATRASSSSARVARTRPRWSSSSSSERPPRPASRGGEARRWSRSSRSQYDGTDFAGWARQPGLRTVQEELERALRTILGETDTRVSR